MRLDRFITLGLVHPFLQISGALQNQGPCLPVLMYHSISDDPEPASSPYYKVCTSPRRFAEHMQWLKDAGWRGVTLSEGLAWLAAESGEQKAINEKPERGAHSHPPAVLRPLSSGQVSTKLVAVTFDDGFRDFHASAVPALQQQGFTATMYVPTAFIDNNRKRFKGRECLTWGEIRELAAVGMEFGSHTVNHRLLYKLPWTEIESELCDSRSVLEQQLGRPVRAFAYPYAFPQENRLYTETLTDLLRKHGYETCATTIIGRMKPGLDPFRVARLPANSADDKALFLAKLNGAYDWLRLPQAGTRAFKYQLQRNPRVTVDPHP